MSKCPPGVICIENVSMFMLFLVVTSYYLYHIPHATKPQR